MSTRALLTFAETSEMLGVSERQLREYISQGKLGFVNMGLGSRRCYRFRPQDIEAFATVLTQRNSGEPVYLSDIRSKQFKEAYEALLNGIPPIGTVDLPDDDLRRLQKSIRGSLKASLNRAAARAKKKDVPFALTMEWAVKVADRQNFRCALTGIPFYTERPGESHAHPYAPSFDRITPQLGYVAENVRLVVVAINAAIGDWGIDVFEQVALGYAAKKRMTVKP